MVKLHKLQANNKISLAFESWEEIAQVIKASILIQDKLMVGIAFVGLVSSMENSVGWMSSWSSSSFAWIEKSITCCCMLSKAKPLSKFLILYITCQCIKLSWLGCCISCCQERLNEDVVWRKANNSHSNNVAVMEFSIKPEDPSSRKDHCCSPMHVKILAWNGKRLMI